MSKPHCTPSRHLTANPWHPPFSPPPAAMSQGAFGAQEDGSGQTARIKEGLFEPEVNRPCSSSFCCKGRQEIWERNVSSAYLPHTQTQRE